MFAYTSLHTLCTPSWRKCSIAKSPYNGGLNVKQLCGKASGAPFRLLGTFRVKMLWRRLRRERLACVGILFKAETTLKTDQDKIMHLLTDSTAKAEQREAVSLFTQSISRYFLTFQLETSTLGTPTKINGLKL